MSECIRYLLRRLPIFHHNCLVVTRLQFYYDFDLFVFAEGCGTVDRFRGTFLILRFELTQGWWCPLPISCCLILKRLLVVSWVVQRWALLRHIQNFTKRWRLFRFYENDIWLCLQSPWYKLLLCLLIIAMLLLAKMRSFLDDSRTKG